MSDNNTAWEEYKKSVIPNKNNKIFERTLENPRIIKNRDNTRLRKNQEFLSNLDNTKYKLLIFSRREQKNFRSQTSIDLHYIKEDLNNILSKFLSKCILYEIHYVTVVTGKGKGILKNSVILWLQQNSQFVIEYFEIKDSRKECGALGIHLRTLNKLHSKQK